jgi:hypothetical protein
MNTDLDSMDRAALLARVRNLAAANGKLRADASRRMDQLRATRRFFSVAYSELPSFLWRHYALCRDLFGPPSPSPTPPRDIPADQLDALDGLS